MKVRYKKGYKYQLESDFSIQTNIHPRKAVESEYFLLTPDGYLYITKGYCWDGASGPAIDTKTFMRGSLVHDVLCQAIRERLLNRHWLKKVDQELILICREDKMSWLRSKWVYRALRLMRGSYAEPGDVRKVYSAP